MRPLLDDPSALRAHLAGTGEALSRERDRLVRGVHALALVEESLQHAVEDDGGLRRLADVIGMPRAIGHLRRYFTEEAWKMAKRFYLEWPQPEWIVLCREIEAAIPEGVSSRRAADLLRWNALAHSVWRGFACELPVSRALHEGFARAWRDRAA